MSDTDTIPEPVRVVRELAKAFVVRASNIGLRGKARDAAALEFMVGAVQAFTLAGRSDLSDQTNRVGMLFVVTRGYAGILSVANKADADK